jgi:hypothetical protein
LPDVSFHQADLVSFDLNRRFDAVLCLGSSIGYIETLDRLRQAVATFARHTCRVAGSSSSNGSAPNSRDCARNRDANGRDERDGTHGSTAACRAEVERRPVSSPRISPCDGASIYDSSTIPRLQRRRS